MMRPGIVHDTGSHRTRDGYTPLQTCVSALRSEVREASKENTAARLHGRPSRLRSDVKCLNAIENDKPGNTLIRHQYVASATEHQPRHAETGRHGRGPSERLSSFGDSEVVGRPANPPGGMAAHGLIGGYPLEPGSSELLENGGLSQPLTSWSRLTIFGASSPTSPAPMVTITLPGRAV